MSTADTPRNPTAFAAFSEAWDRYCDLHRRSDEAFARYFAKRQLGEATNGAATRRLENMANEASIQVYTLWTAAHHALGSEIDPYDLLQPAPGLTERIY
jgi:hypothetical protein